MRIKSLLPVLLSFMLFFVSKINAQTIEIKSGDTVSGRVIKIHDGDTYDVRLTTGDNIRIRMEGIDAPEGGMAYYRVAKNFLNKLANNQNVRIQINEKESRDRYVALTYLEDGRELSCEMLKAGLAWHYKEFNDYPTFAEMEEEARKNKIGLWEEENPVPPWIHRRLRRQKISTKDLNPFRQKVLQITENKKIHIYEDLKLEAYKTSDNPNYKIKISRKDKSVQEIQTNESGDFRISLADYNMDNKVDIKIGEGQSGYYLFDSDKDSFVERKDWKLSFWKLNRPEKHILTLPEGSAYSGKIKLYQVEDDYRLKLLIDLKYY